MSFHSATLLVIITVLGLISSACCQDLYYNYYDNSCDWFEEIVARKVRQAFYKDKTIAASLLRLHFHDCAVRVWISNHSLHFFFFFFSGSATITFCYMKCLSTYTFIRYLSLTFHLLFQKTSKVNELALQLFFLKIYTSVVGVRLEPLASKVKDGAFPNWDNYSLAFTLTFHH